MEKIMLSADGDIMLYEVNKKIMDNFDDILEEFFDTKKTNFYDEKLFVEFLKNRFGNESIKFIKNLGNNIPVEYKDIKWFNF